MALNNPPQNTLEEAAVDTTRTSVEPESISESDEEVDIEELERLESEAKEMAKKILEYRATLPNQLEATLASFISAQRPIIPSLDPGSNLGPVGEINPGGEQVKPSKSSSVTEGYQTMNEKAQLLKDKISSNVSAMPNVLKRLKECISKIDKLDSYNGTIPPVFKKKKPS